MNMVRTNFGFNNSCSFPSASFPKYSSYFRPKTPFCDISGRWYFRVPYCVFIKTAAGPYFLQEQRNFIRKEQSGKDGKDGKKKGRKKGKRKRKRKRKGKKNEKKRESKAEKRKRAEKRRAERKERERERERKTKNKRGRAKRERQKEREKEEKETTKAVSSPQPCTRHKVFPLQKSRNPRFRL